MSQKKINDAVTKLQDNPGLAIDTVMDLIRATRQGDKEGALNLSSTLGTYITFLESQFQLCRELGEIIHNTTAGMQSAVIAEDAVDGAGMKWIFNALMGPGQLPDPETTMTAQQWYDYHHITYCTKTRKYTKSDGGDYDEYNESQ